MRDYVIVTDSGCDLSHEMVEKLGVKVVPMGLLIDGRDYKHYSDYRELSMADFQAKIAAGHVGKTSCINMMDAMNVMKEIINDGKDVLYISFSSGMSGSYQAACLAARETSEEYPDAKIDVVDTFAGCVGLGMLTYLAVKKKNEGASMDEVAQYIRDISLNINHFFMVEDLGYIQKTGRISTISAIMGTALGIRPIFKLDNDGKVALVEKIRGRKTGVRNLIEKAKTRCSKPDLFFVAHMNAEDDANTVAAQLRETYPDAEFIVGPVGPILGNNTGPGALAVIFYGEER